MRGNASRYPDKQLSNQAALMQLSLLLANATDDKLAGFTVDNLERMYRVPRREIECKLLAAQDRRRREAAQRP